MYNALFVCYLCVICEWVVPYEVRDPVVGMAERHPGVDHLVGGLQRQGELVRQEVVVHDEAVPDALRGTVADQLDPCPDEWRLFSSPSPLLGTGCTDMVPATRF
jgi:hypothetical protein